MKTQVVPVFHFLYKDTHKWRQRYWQSAFIYIEYLAYIKLLNHISSLAFMPKITEQDNEDSL